MIGAASIQFLVDAGLDAQQIADFARTLESDQSHVSSAAAERQRRYRARYDISPQEWRRVRALVFQRDNFTCAYCGYQGGDVSCDHVVPLISGGSSDISNLVTACVRCNSGKSGRTPEEWLA